MIRMRTTAVLGFCLLALGACSYTPLHLYPGDRQPPEQLASLALHGYGGVHVRTINGHRLDPVERSSITAYVKPGRNTVGVEYTLVGALSRTWSEEVSTDITVQAEHLYVFHHQISDDQKLVSFRLVDYGTGLPPFCHAHAIMHGGPDAPEVAACVAEQSAKAGSQGR